MFHRTWRRAAMAVAGLLTLSLVACSEEDTDAKDLDGNRAGAMADYGVGDQFTASAPQTLFRSRIAPNASVPQYGVTADGERFLGLERLEGDRSFTFLVNWLKTN